MKIATSVGCNFIIICTEYVKIVTLCVIHTMMRRPS